MPQRLWFQHYSQAFDTVEINASFYRLPLAKTFEGWRDKAPPGFRYAIKVNRFITHNKKLLDCDEPVDDFIALARLLGDRLGPLLYQMPPSLRRNDERLARHAPGDRVMVGISTLPADLVGPGKVRSHGDGGHRPSTSA